jgi:hypothetical protein
MIKDIEEIENKSEEPFLRAHETKQNLLSVETKA